MKYYLYILKSENYSKSYVGISNDVERRLIEHNSGNSFYTKRYRPWKMIYTEDYNSVLDARKREKYLKSCAGRKFLKKIFSTRIV
jgi:putative endonuclease